MRCVLMWKLTVLGRAKPITPKRMQDRLIEVPLRPPHLTRSLFNRWKQATGLSIHRRMDAIYDYVLTVVKMPFLGSLSTRRSNMLPHLSLIACHATHLLTTAEAFVRRVFPVMGLRQDGEGARSSSSSCMKLGFESRRRLCENLLL